MMPSHENLQTIESSQFTVIASLYILYGLECLSQGNSKLYQGFEICPVLITSAQIILKRQFVTSMKYESLHTNLRIGSTFSILLKSKAIFGPKNVFSKHFRWNFMLSSIREVSHVGNQSLNDLFDAYFREPKKKCTKL